MKTLSVRDACGIVLLIVVLVILAWNYQIFPFGRGKAEIEVTITPDIQVFEFTEEMNR